MWRVRMGKMGVAVAVGAMVLAQGANARAELIADRVRHWTADDKGKCLAENDHPSPQVRAERNAIAKSDAIVSLDVAMGGYMGGGTPAGVGGSLGHDKQGNPYSAGWAGFARADVLALRPLWLSAQVTGMGSPTLGSGALSRDLFVGYTFHHYGNSFIEGRRKYTHEPYYGCTFGRADAALVVGVKNVDIFGDGRIAGWQSFMAGTQLRFVTHFRSLDIGLEMDILGMYEPGIGAGGQLQTVLHLGHFILTEQMAAQWGRGAWGLLGAGFSFEL